MLAWSNGMAGRYVSDSHAESSAGCWSSATLLILILILILIMRRTDPEFRDGTLSFLILDRRSTVQ
jgi:uncharacterized integral membrane protein